ncbi:MAG: phosphatidate cytidylyltransferase [Pirellulales bacterium]|nr:phosphatidate cytidylyltransferase [Pirellulales bacterium]
MLYWRLLLGGFLIVGFGALFWLDGTQAGGAPPAAWLFPLVLVGAILGTNDLLWLFQARGWDPSPRVMLFGNLAIVSSNAVPLFWPDYPVDFPLGRWGWPGLTGMVMLLVAFVAEMRRYHEPGKPVLHLALNCLAWCYLGFLLSVLVQLRAFDLHARGLLAIASLVIVTKAGDIGAFTVGRILGRTQMTPILSPGKTWEGAAGAVLFACLAAIALGYWWAPFLPPGDTSTGNWGELSWPRDSLWESTTGKLIRWAIYGAILAVAGMIGDLAESLIKRDVGRKDSGNWLPGFGGVLDLLDSVLYAGPVAYICWLVRLVP